MQLNVIAEKVESIQRDVFNAFFIKFSTHTSSVTASRPSYFSVTPTLLSLSILTAEHENEGLR